MANNPQRATLPFHPAFDGPVFYTTERRPAGDDDEANTAQTIGLMAQYAIEDSLNPLVRSAAHEATRNSSGDRGDAEAIWHWIRSHVAFSPEEQLSAPVVGEARARFAQTLIRPIDLILMPHPKGHCACQSMLCAAMLRAIGIPSRYKTAAVDEEDPESYSHVYVIADLDSGPFALDCSHGPYPGAEIQAIGKTRTWPVERSLMRLGDTASIDFPAATSPSIDAGGGGGTDTTGTDWTSVLNTISTDVTKIAQPILSTRYGVPQLAPGQVIRLANGTYAAQYPAGATLGTGLSATTLIMIAVIIGVVIFAGKH